MNLLDLFDLSFVGRRDSIALEFGAGEPQPATYTFGDLDRRSNRMAGSFGYLWEHYDISQKIGERHLLPAVRNQEPGTILVASGTSCRNQVEHFTQKRAAHPAVLLRSLQENHP